MTKLLDAIQYAQEKHKGQTYNGLPYINHLLGVALLLENPSEDLKISAILHDIIEDTDADFNDVSRLFGSEIALTVHILTHREGSYLDYIAYVHRHKEARLIKIADLTYNIYNGKLNGHPKLETYELALRMLTELL